MYAFLARVRLPDREGRQPELKKRELKRKVGISGTGPAPGKGGKAAGAEHEQFSREREQEM